MTTPRIKTWQDGYVDLYPEFGEIADQQMKIFWPWDEPKVEKDKHDFLVGMPEANRKGNIYCLKLFTKYELFVGNEHWGSRVAKTYPHVSIQRMCAAFAHVELNSHAKFYNEINRILGLDTMEFYTEYLNDPVLAERMKFIDGLVNHEDDEVSTAVFSLVEGAVLYSTFAYLKANQAKGSNWIMNSVRGINMSVRDENLHSIGGAMIVRTALKERNVSKEYMEYFTKTLHEAAWKIYEHECQIIDTLFSFGKHENITATQMKHFVMSRLNICLKQLDLPILEEVSYNPIAEWFYKGINDYQLNDFFTGVGREYTRDWSEHSFTWKTK